MEQQLAEIHPRLVLSPSARARRIALRLDTKERIVRLVLPKRFPQRKALKFARDHREWIAEKMASLPVPVLFEDGAMIPVFGQERTIRYLRGEAATAQKDMVLMHEHEIRVKAMRGEPASRVQRFLKGEVCDHLTCLAHEKAEKVGKRVSRVSVRDTKSRWGSCTDKGNLSFSWRLVFAPYETLDYIVAHEVAHLVHLDHSRAFWAVCRELSADYRAGKRWIKDHGHELMKYGA